MRPSLQSKRPVGRHGGPRRRRLSALLGALVAIALTLTAGAAAAHRGSHVHKLRPHRPTRGSVAERAYETGEQPPGALPPPSLAPSSAGEGAPAGGEAPPLPAPQQQPFAASLAQSSTDAGHAKFRLDANSKFDRYSSDGGFIEAHVDVVKAYPPYGDVYVQYGKPVIGYHDPATEGYAPLEKPQIERFVAAVRRDMSKGYAGVFVDDANWSFSPSPGPEANLANLLEAIRAAEPGALIEMNSQYHDIWPKMKASDPSVARALAQVNLVTKEFGVGPDAAITTGQDYGEFLSYADTLREKGIHLVMTGDENARSVRVEEYNQATCLLVNDGGDYVNGARPRPGHFWKGFKADLGSALGPRERSSSGLWTRRFSGGAVYAVEPGGATQTIQLGRRMRSAEWHKVASVTLSAGEGAVFAG
jgi:hypothetical protein